MGPSRVTAFPLVGFGADVVSGFQPQHHRDAGAEGLWDDVQAEDLGRRRVLLVRSEANNLRAARRARPRSSRGATSLAGRSAD